MRIEEKLNHVYVYSSQKNYVCKTSRRNIIVITTYTYVAHLLVTKEKNKGSVCIYDSTKIIVL